MNYRKDPIISGAGNAVKFARNLVTGLQEHRGFVETMRNGLSVKENNLENTRTSLTHLDQRLRELRIRKIRARVPTGAQHVSLKSIS